MDAGHKLVAEIAFAHLDTHGQDQVKLLFDKLQNDYPELKQESDIAIWPDLIRKQSIDVYTHWHYINIPYSSDHTQSTLIEDTDNALWALKQIEKILSNPQVKISERSRFTSLLIHIVGDCTNLYTVFLA